jgi:type II restriction enzyme
MDLQLPLSLSVKYRSNTQRVRVMTEGWAHQNAYCPDCLSPIVATTPNTPATDFLCRACTNAFELKSKSGSFGARIVDGAYSAMSSRINDGTQPHLFLLSYTAEFHVAQFEVIPRSFLTLPVIERRNPLSDRAKRSGWVGCNIVIGDVPEDGRIPYVRNGEPAAPATVQAQWQRSAFLDRMAVDSRGWLVATMNCLRRLGRREFSLREAYEFEEKLRKQFPNNRHIRAKIRQQLQLLRDRGWLEFKGRGSYSIRAG